MSVGVTVRGIVVEAAVDGDFAPNRAGRTGLAEAENARCLGDRLRVIGYEWDGQHGMSGIGWYPGDRMAPRTVAVDVLDATVVVVDGASTDGSRWMDCRNFSPLAAAVVVEVAATAGALHCTDRADCRWPVAVEVVGVDVGWSHRIFAAALGDRECVDSSQTD